jgi:hypothetical protein
MNFYTVFAEHVHSYLRAHPYETDHHIARRAKVHIQTLRRIMRAEDRPSQLNLERICCFGMGYSEEECAPLVYLLSLEPPRNHAMKKAS